VKLQAVKHSPFFPHSPPKKCCSVSCVLFREGEALGAGACAGTDQNFTPQHPSSTWGFSDVLDSSGDEKASILLRVQGVAFCGGVVCLLSRFPSSPPPLLFSFPFPVDSFTFCSAESFLRRA